MSDLKVTLGPWRIEPGQPLNIIDGDGGVIAYVTPRLYRAGNAALIAAAPELLAALKVILQAERISNRPPETVAQAEAKLEAIRQAVILAEYTIAKAEGRTA